MSPDYPQHPNDCWCVACFNHGIDLELKKRKNVNVTNQPRACDDESMATYREYYLGDPSWKA